MDYWLIALAALAAVALAAGGWRPGLFSALGAYWPRLEAARRREIVFVESIPGLPAHWQSQAELERLVDRQPELEALLVDLGFQQALERRFAGVLSRLRATARVEIPDPDAFFDALERAEGQLAEPTGAEPEALRLERLEKRQHPLLQQVLRADRDLGKILHLLGEEPIDSRLPFIEEIPFHRDGEVIWRTPIDLAVVRKTPRDPERFAALLGELRQAVETASVERPAQATDDLLDAIARARRAARRPDVYLPTVITGLEAEVSAWLDAVPDQARARRDRLFELLRRVLELRARYGLESPLDVPALRADALRDFKRSMLQAVQLYLGEPWMRQPWLTAHLLAGLLTAELAELPPTASPQGPRPALERVHREAASGLYDGEESIHRLHRLEERGIAVHSLVYALLRSPETPAPSGAAASDAAPSGTVAAARQWRRRAGVLR